MNIVGTLHVDFGSDLVITGHNPENADISNPYGHRYGESYFVVVIDEAGHRWEHIKRYTNDKTAAEKFAASVARWVAKGGRLAADFWREVQPVYGSDAYVAGGYEQIEIERERMESDV